MRYTVWIGGGEVNDYLITDKMKAYYLAEYWDSMGFDDVRVEELPDDDEEMETGTNGYAR